MYELINLIAYAAFMLTLSAVIGYVGYYLARYIKTLKPSRSIDWPRVAVEITEKIISTARKEKEWEASYRGKNKASLMALKDIIERTCQALEYERMVKTPRSPNDDIHMRQFFDAKQDAYREIISEINILMSKYE